MLTPEEAVDRCTKLIFPLNGMPESKIAVSVLASTMLLTESINRLIDAITPLLRPTYAFLPSDGDHPHWYGGNCDCKKYREEKVVVSIAHDPNSTFCTCRDCTIVRVNLGRANSTAKE